MADLLLGVKIGVQGGPQSVKEIKAIDDQVRKLQEQNARVAATAKALSEAYDLSDAEVSQLVSELQRLENQTKGVTREARSLDAVFQGLLQGFGQQLTQIGFQAFNSSVQAVQSTIATASQAFGDFDKQLTLFASKSGIAKDQLGALEEESKRLAAATTQSPASVAALATTLLTLGASAEESIERLEGIVKLSDVIGEDPVLTGKVVQTALTTYAAFGETADGVADKFKTLIDTTAAGSTGGIDEFLQLFQSSAPAAQALGVTFDDLSAAFATARDAGASAAVASTGLKIAMLSLANPTGASVDAIAELNLQAFDAQGNFIGLQESLQQFNEKTRQFSQEKRVRLATQIFGNEGAPVVLALLSQVDQKYSQTLSNLQQSAGGVAKALDVVNQELDGQRNLLEGDLEAAYTNLGEAFAPIELGLIKFTRGLITAVNEGGGGLNALNEAAIRLSESLSNNPELVAQLGSALSQVGAALSQSIATQLDRITAALENNPELFQNLAQSFVDGAQQVIQLAGALGQIAGVLVNLGANFAQAGASVFSSIAPTLISLVDVINAAVQALQPLLANTKLVEVAFQVLLVRMVALKAVGLANSFIGIAAGLAGLVKGAFSATAAIGALNVAQATGSKSALLMAQSLAANGVAATTAAAGFKAAALAAATATGPLIALTAAIATANFIKTTQDLRFTNDELEAFANGVTVAGNTGMKFANDLNNINDSIASAGGKATAEQRKQLADNVKLAKEQIASLQQELTNIQSIQPRNDSQRQSQQNLTQQVTTVIDSLNKQIGEAESTLSGAAGGLGDKTGKAVAGGIKDGLAGTPGEVAASIDGVSDAVGREVDETETELDRLSTANQKALGQLELDSANARAALLESGGDPARLAQAEKTSLEQRIAENKKFLENLKGLQGLEGEEAAKVADQIRQTELTLANDRVALAQQVLQAKKQAEEEAKQSAIKALDERLRIDQTAANLETQRLELKSQSLQTEQQLLAQQQGVETALLTLERERLETKLAQAEAEGRTTEAKTLQQQIDQLNQESIAQEFEFKRQQLELEFALAQAENQRAVVLSQIAVIEAEIAVSKAQANGATTQEIAQLQEVVKLRKDAAQAAKDAAGVTDELFTARREELEIQEDISKENQKQSEAQKKQAEAEKNKTAQTEATGAAQSNVTGELGKQQGLAQKIADLEQKRADLLVQALSTSRQETAESLKQLDAIRSRFREAQQAGLFQGVGGEFEAAAAQLEGILKSGGNLKDLIKFAQSNNSQIATQLLEAVGRGDVLKLIEADQASQAFQSGGQTAGDEIEQGIVRGGQQAAATIGNALSGGSLSSLIAPLPRKDGGPVAPGQSYLVGEQGPELITPSRRGWVHTAGETVAMMAKQPTMLVKNQSMPGIEAKLSELLQEVKRGRRVAVPTSYTLNTVNPLEDAISLQIKQVRALARGRVL